MLRRREVLLAATGLAASAVLSSCESEPEHDSVDPRSVFDSAVHRLDRSRSPLFYPASSSDPGILPWGTAYVLQALQVMLDKTLDGSYARQFIDVAERVLPLRDNQIGVHDFRGRSGSVWSVANRYTVERADVLDPYGTRVFVLSSAEFLSPPDRSVVVLPQNNGIFDVAVVDTRRRKTLEVVRRLSTDERDASYAPTQLRSISPTKTWLTCQDLRTRRDIRTQLPRQNAPLKPQRVAFAVHSGMIAAPLVEFYQTVRRNSALSDYMAQAEKYRGVAEDAWAFHRDEIRFSSGFASVVIPRGTPVRADGCAVPHNQAATLGRLGSGLGWASNMSNASASARAIFKSLMSDMRPVAAGGVTWPYNWTQSDLYRGFSANSDVSTYTPVMESAPGPEDVSHGALDVSALIVGHSNNNGVTKTTLDQLRATYRRLLSTDDFAATVAQGAAQRGGSQSVNLWAEVAPQPLLDNPLAIGQLSQVSGSDTPNGGQLLGAARLVRRSS